MIREGKTFQIPSLLQTSKNQGMQSMDQALLDLVKTRKIDAAEALVHASDKKIFQNMTQGGGAMGGMI